ncbi:beta-alanine-activating enzyme-like isoform X2 [Asterias rubens]|uniref:beta-alanine-activating enzyme-like isoform X2 n=1 Tax=Asterias rubens TaxID=7604 RepID=UPI001454F807|nr:beta-alanine-activating enzyme-like isoform X2 [Asterias rubens]
MMGQWSSAGILDKGSSFAPIDPRAPSDINEYFISTLDLSWMLLPEDLEETFLENHGKAFKAHSLGDPLGLKGVCFRLFKLLANQRPSESSLSESAHLAYAMHTSGTTGKPKIVRVPHQCIVPNIQDLSNTLGISEDDIIFMASPLTFDPSIVEMFTALSQGATLVMVPDVIKVVPRRLIGVLTRNQVSVLQATPTLISRFGQDVLHRTLLSAATALRILAFGGESCPTMAQINHMRAADNTTAFYNLYGITEVSSWATCHRIDVESGTEKESHKSIPLGKPLLATTLEVRDMNDQPITQGQGQLYIGGDTRVCLLDGENLTIPLDNRVMRPSGDWVSITDRGLVFIGRQDDQVKRHGKRVSLSQIKKRVEILPHVESCEIIHTSQDKLLVFCVMSKTQSSSAAISDEESLRDFLADVLPSHCRPDQSYSLETLPVTLHGKVDARALLQYAKEVDDCGWASRAWREGGQMQRETFAALWMNALSSSTEPSDTDFFIQNGGGDSFRAVQLLDAVESQKRLAFPDLLDVILHETFSRVLEHIQRNVSEMTHYLEDGSDLDSPAQEQEVVVVEQQDAKQEDRLLGSGLANKDEQRILTPCGFSEIIPTNKEQQVDVVGQQVVVLEERLLRNYFECQDDQRILMHSEIFPTTQAATNTGSTTLHAKPKDEELELDYQQIPKRRKISCKSETLTKDGADSETKNENSLALCDNSSALESAVRDSALVREAFGPSGIMKLEERQKAIEKHVSSKKEMILMNQDADEVDNDAKGMKNHRLMQNSEYHVSHSKRINNSVSAWTPKEESDVCSSTAAEQKSIHDKIKLNLSDDDICTSSTCHLSQNTCHDIPRSSRVSYAVRRCSQWMRDAEFGLGNICGEKKEATSNCQPPQLIQRWRYDTGKCVDASPLVVLTTRLNTVVYIGSHSHKFAAVTMATGRALWVTELGDRIESSACLSTSGSKIIVGCYDNNLYTLDSESGKVLWKFKSDGPIKSSPVADHGSSLVYVGSHDKHLYALDVEDYSCKWRVYCGGGSLFSSPSAHHQSSTVYVATLTGSLVAIDKHTGLERWTFSCGKPIFSSPSVSRDSVVFGSVNGILYCLDHDGKQLWSFSTNAPIFSSPCVSPSVEDDPLSPTLHVPHKSIHHSAQDACIVFGSHDHYVYCVCLTTGKLQWRHRMPSTAYASPFIFRNHRLSNQRLSKNHHTCSKESAQSDCAVHPCLQYLGPEKAANYGQLSKEMPPHLPTVSNGCMASLFVAVCSTEGSVMIFDLRSGEVLASCQLPGEVFSSPVVVGDYLVVGCRDDYVYCLEIS